MGRGVFSDGVGVATLLLAVAVAVIGDGVGVTAVVGAHWRRLRGAAGARRGRRHDCAPAVHDHDGVLWRCT